MTRRLLLSYLSVTLFVLLVLEIPLGITFARNKRDDLSREIERDATVLTTMVEDGLENEEPVDYQGVADNYAQRTGARVVIVDRAGISVADTENDSRRDFSTRPEFERALSGERASGTRHSDTLRTDVLYVAVPVASGGRVFGALRLTFPTAEIDRLVTRNWAVLGVLALVVLATVTLVGFVLARSVARPLRDIEAASAAMAAGALSARTRQDEGPPDVRELAHTFNVMAERIERLVGSQRDFVADAAHQLRTPLTALRLRLENLEGVVAPEAAADLQGAVDETRRLAGLVDRLLVLARAEEGDVPVEVVDLAAEVRERVQHWKPLFDERGVGLEIAGPTTVAARAVSGSVAQILDNLLSNALAVTPAGRAVTVSASPSGAWSEMHVVDEGPGMDEENRRRAFDRFWRSSAPAGRGFGLGLPIVRELATAAGGQAELREAPGGGLDAMVVLPSAPAVAPPVRPPVVAR